MTAVELRLRFGLRSLLMNSTQVALILYRLEGLIDYISSQYWSFSLLFTIYGKFLFAWSDSFVEYFINELPVFVEWTLFVVAAFGVFIRFLR